MGVETINITDDWTVSLVKQTQILQLSNRIYDIKDDLTVKSLIFKICEIVKHLRSNATTEKETGLKL